TPPIDPSNSELDRLIKELTLTMERQKEVSVREADKRQERRKKYGRTTPRTEPRSHCYVNHTESAEEQVLELQEETGDEDSDVNICESGNRTRLGCCRIRRVDRTRG
ncbi:5557_t:CDS:2, partial [Ambispora gerdemannii]